jgi:hypothetical protein
MRVCLWACLVGTTIVGIGPLGARTASAADRQVLLMPRLRGECLHDHSRDRYYGEYHYPHGDPYAHYPKYGYGMGMPTYHWGWFGYHHRPQRVVQPNLSGHTVDWSIRYSD